MLAFDVKGYLSPWLLPPVSLFLLVVLGLLISRRSPRVGGWLVALGAVTGIATTMPFFADRLIGWVEAPYARLDPPPRRLPQARLARWAEEPAEAPQAIVVLSGGAVADGSDSSEPNRPATSSLERILHASRLVRLTGLPVLVSGGVTRRGGAPEAVLLSGVLEQDLGTPVRWIETKSRDTAENAAFTREILEPLGIRRVLLVTHAYHMRRAEAAFAAAGFTVTPAPHSFMAGSLALTPLQFVPTLDAVGASQMAAREAIGQLWYRLNRLNDRVD
jgi:uncharacterized SAM-binding protein YcdF (DUF218 family)